MRPAFRAALMALPTLAVAGALIKPLPAAAQATNFRQEWDDIKNSIPYVGTDREPIDFTERAPLVVPPSNALPPPVDSAWRAGVSDGDVMARRKAMSDPRRPVPVNDPGAAATGLSARTYLIDPPSGMRDPAVVEAGIVTDKPRHAPETKTHHKHARVKRTPDPSASAAAE